MKIKIPAQVLVIIAAVLWGTTGSAQALAPSQAHPIAIGALRMLVGGSILFVYVLLSKKFQYKNMNKIAVLFASFSIAFYQPLFFMSVKLTGVAFGTVLAIGSAPIFAGILDLLKTNEIKKNWLYATLISIMGCVLLFLGQGQMRIDLFGALLALFAGMSYAIYVHSSGILLKDSNVASVNGIVFFGSGLILLPSLFFMDLDWVMTLNGVLVIAHLGIISTAVAYTLFAFALVRISSPEAVTLTLVEPLTAAMLGFFLLKEELSVISLLGIGLMFIGLLLTGKSNRLEEPI